MSGNHLQVQEGEEKQRGDQVKDGQRSQTKKEADGKEAGHGNEPVDAHLPEVLPNFLGRMFWASFGQLLHYRVLLGELVNVMLAEPLNAQPCIGERERERGRERQRQGERGREADRQTERVGEYQRLASALGKRIGLAHGGKGGRRRAGSRLFGLPMHEGTGLRRRGGAVLGNTIPKVLCGASKLTLVARDQAGRGLELFIDDVEER